MSEIKQQTLRDRLTAEDSVKKREEIMKEIRDDYRDNGGYQVTQAKHNNIMLIGRTRTGKSTIKSLLIDPTVVPEDLTLVAGTRDPLFESFHVQGNNMILNIIDTPGLFEHGTSEITVRDNDTILRTISNCANREITKFHAICFCVTITEGVNQEDIASLKLLTGFLGSQISKNSCLIITKCESKDDGQRKKICDELKQNNHFKEIASSFELGIFFSGALNRDDYNQGNTSLLKQFKTIIEYRKKLIELFTTNTEPFPITKMLISNIQEVLLAGTAKEAEIKDLEQRTDKQKLLIQELRTTVSKDENTIKKLIEDLNETTKPKSKPIHRDNSACSPS